MFRCDLLLTYPRRPSGSQSGQSKRVGIITIETEKCEFTFQATFLGHQLSLYLKLPNIYVVVNTCCNKNTLKYVSLF